VVSAALIRFFVLVLLTPLLAQACSDEQGSETIADVLTDVGSEYYAPVVEAAPGIACWRVNPQSRNAECGHFVDVLDKSNPGLDRAIERLTAIAEDYEGEGIGILRFGIYAFELQNEADESLVSAWRSQDFTRWQDAWDLMEEASQEWEVFMRSVQALASEG
jgi:hypothetical protein